ncbi:hypothetical protein HPB48_026030 [Haemaphysalis longicornis]|uniref:Uncharacterized protein n=1 Tax=Haemaphysalis longicornis TaxID=44386 RepID=A0A9J6HB19_HAELO|nr:hypothetical protein HPB48_026030 [Haemaphysalis longicornis]
MAAYCGTSDEDALSDSVCDAVTTDAWKGQLDFDRACSGPEQRCWLSTELTPWNRVMHGLAFELVELRPGKLCLRPTPQDDGDRDRGTVDAEASFLVSWLLQHHPCIDELKVAPSVHFQGTGVKKTSFPIRLRPAGVSGSFRTIRGLEVGTNGSCLIISAREALAKAQYHFNNKKPTRHSLYELEDLEAVGGLVRLKFVALREIEPVYFAKLAKLLRRNPNSIKRLEISLRNLPRQVNHALGYLFSCESLMISSYNDDGHRASLPSMKPVARLLHSSTALKELSITPVANRTQISAIAKELETNTSLAKLDLRMADSRCSPKALFTALQVNTTLKELQVRDCRISGECGQALALLLQKNTGLRLLYIKDSVISASTLAVLVTALTRNTTLESLQLSSGVLPKNGIVELCKVLRINKTLKKLQFTNLECPKKFRAALARQLARDDCYNRVQLPWIERDLPGLTAALTSAFAGFEELHLSGIHCMSEAGLKQLFDALPPTSVSVL